MRRRILSVGPTDVYLHMGTALFALYALLTGTWAAVGTAFGSILLHEGGHGAAAALLGQPPREMELTPLGAVLRLEDEERLPPLRRALMLMAGPAVTLLLCLLSLRLTACGWLPVEAGRRLFMANLAILLINLLPALPLDGGRLLTLALSCFLRGETVRRVMRLTGTALGLLAAGGSVYLTWKHGQWNASLAAAGCFLMYSAATATTTQAMAELRRLLDRKIALETRGYAPCREVAVLGSEPVYRAVRLLHPRRMTHILLMEPGTMKGLGSLGEAELISAFLKHPQETLIQAWRRAGEPEQR